MKPTMNPFSYRSLLSWSASIGHPLTNPLFGSLRINDGCNSRCTYCWIWKHPVYNISLEDAEHAVAELQRIGLRLIGLTGGEPLYHPNLEEIVRVVRSHRMTCSLNTNGLLLTPERLKKLSQAGLNGMVLSLDTLQPAVYLRHRGVPLEPVLRGLEHVLYFRDSQPNFNFSINCVVTRLNVRELPELTAYFSQRNVAIGFQPLHPTFARETGKEEELAFRVEDLPALEDAIERLVALKRAGYRINNEVAYLEAFPALLAGHALPQEFACLAGFTSIAVDHRLYVRSCWPLPPIGDLHYDRLPVLWKSAKYRQRRREMVKLQCPKCWLRCHTEFSSQEDFLRLFA